MNKELFLPLRGRVDLDGTHRAVIQTADHDLVHLFEKGETKHVSLGAKGVSCACVLVEVAKAEEDVVLIDRYKLRHLGLEDGDSAQLTFTSLPAAKRLDLRTSAEFGERDAIRFIGKPLVSGEQTALFTFSGEPRIFTITNTVPEGPVVVSPSTDIVMADSQVESAPITYGDIGGLDREIKLVREAVEYPLKFRGVFDHLGVTPPKGIILHGPPGTGKTLLAKALANQVGARFYSISGPEIYSKWYGRSEENLRNIFDEAIKNSPSVVVIDELDALVPRRDSTHGDQEQRIVATFLTQMDGLKEVRDVVVVGTTNRINAIDPALRRGGRFEHEVLIGVPDADGREQILSIHAMRMPLAKDAQLGPIAESTNGFVGADLASLCREAAYNALRRTTPADVFESNEEISPRGLEVTQEDFEEALKVVPPSGAREFTLDVPKVGWEQIGGLEEPKRILIENITIATKKREAFERMGVRPATGLLLHGPPGTGKTLLARAVAGQSGANFIALRGTELRSRWRGEAEERVRFVFARARLLAPCVVFIDELDSAVPVRGGDTTGASEAVVNQLLSEMDGIEGHGGVFVMGATNRIDAVDPAVLRPGRFDHLVEVPLPDEAARREVFKVHLDDKPLAKDVDAALLARKSEGLSGAQIAEICRLAALDALRGAEYEAEGLTMNAEHLERALEAMKRSASK